MNWNTIVSGKRTGESQPKQGIRTDFQRDYDRLVFSSPFRRLKNKTKIFRLPGSVFVHNRLTLLLEVASVGRSLGKMVGEKLVEKGLIDEQNSEFYYYELQNVISSACLGHDIGNPSFGHSGEKAISNFFQTYQDLEIESKKPLKDYFEVHEWQDLISFEGNANSFRILTHHFNGKSEGGLMLTYTTLAALMKYPCTADAMNPDHINSKKFSIFQLDKTLATEIFEELRIDKASEDPLVFKRHPFVYLTEAADDICYRIIDFEDAQRLKILSQGYVAEIFLNLIKEIGREEDRIDRIRQRYDNLEDENEKIAYLRAKCINSLALEAVDVYMENINRIIQGNYNTGLIDELTRSNPFLQEIQAVSNEKIYNFDSVVQLEITGYKIMSDLLSLFIPAMLKSRPDHKDEKVLRLLPKQFRTNNLGHFHKVFSVLDYLSGITDPYAVELYRKLFGIDIPHHT